MTPETLTLLRNVLTAQVLTVGQDDFLAVATAAAAALAEVDAAIAGLNGETANPETSA